MAQELWQIAKPFGRPAKFKSPQELWAAFLRYVEWSAANPMSIGESRLQRNKSRVQDKKQSDENYRQQYKHTVERPLTIIAFQLHAGIKREWSAFKVDYSKKSEDFCRVISAIEHTVRQQQVQNAMVGNYKENLVARLNGISDSIEQKVTSEVTVRKGLSRKEARELLADIEKEI